MVSSGRPADGHGDGHGTADSDVPPTPQWRPSSPAGDIGLTAAGRRSAAWPVGPTAGVVDRVRARSLRARVSPTSSRVTVPGPAGRRTARRRDRRAAPPPRRRGPRRKAAPTPLPRARPPHPPPVAAVQVRRAAAPPPPKRSPGMPASAPGLRVRRAEPGRDPARPCPFGPAATGRPHASARPSLPLQRPARDDSALPMHRVRIGPTCSTPPWGEASPTMVHRSRRAMPRPRSPPPSLRAWSLLGASRVGRTPAHPARTPAHPARTPAHPALGHRGAPPHSRAKPTARAWQEATRILPAAHPWSAVPAGRVEAHVRHVR
jgi:hypothetical protein